MNALRTLALLAMVALGGVFVPSTAHAQTGGTCSCNNGCHSRPGQCVTSNGCATGYAPYCGVRATSCPQMGWVSCNGECSCIAIPGFDAGVPDASSSDVVSVDAPVDVNRPDAPTDTRPDAPGSDVVPPDVAEMDATVPPDCPNGVVLDNVCYTEPCEFQTEFGWICFSEGTECRLIDDHPWCIPFCAARTCKDGEFCDPRSGCTLDLCAEISCAPGQVCERNQCIVPGSDGGPMAADGGFDGGVDGGNGTGTETGCGCRTAGASGSGGFGLLALGAAAVMVRARRRTRRAA